MAFSMLSKSSALVSHPLLSPVKEHVFLPRQKIIHLRGLDGVRKQGCGPCWTDGQMFKGLAQHLNTRNAVTAFQGVLCADMK